MTEDMALTEQQQQAFYSRIDQLYRLYEDWTGTKDEDDGDEGESDESDESSAAAEAHAEGPASSPEVIEPAAALSTFAVFTARLALDYQMERSEFLEALGTMYDNERDEGGDEQEPEERAALS